MTSRMREGLKNTREHVTCEFLGGNVLFKSIRPMMEKKKKKDLKDQHFFNPYHSSEDPVSMLVL